VVRRPLEGLRVLDLTRFVAGSQATALLAAFGADVVKLEVPPDGDPYRAQGTERLGDQSVLFLSLNSGKRSLGLDFRSPLAAEALDRLLASSHFLVENARPGSLARYGLDWEAVHERYPSIVFGSISGYGDVGPASARGGFDLILQAESGLMSVTGSESSGPVKVGAPVLDVGAALCCSFGLLAAHVERERTGVGTHVSSSLLEFALASLGSLAASTFVSGEAPGLLGTHSPTFAPYGGFRTADGWIVVAGAGSEDLWVRCCKVLGADHLLDDPRFADNAARVRHRDELTEALEEVLRRETTAHWLASLEAEGVPAAEVQDIARVFAGEQARALEAIQELHHATAGDYRVVGAPVRLDTERFPYPSAAPSLGQHTFEVLDELGFPRIEVDRLVSEGVAVAS
jgi:crotonobetainyl-CoA:carnitine CoA-transferase CaiB-like acyl-CoA transferase